MAGAKFGALPRFLPIRPEVQRCKAQSIWGSGEYLKTGQERLTVDHKLCDTVCVCVCVCVRACVLCVQIIYALSGRNGHLIITGVFCMAVHSNILCLFVFTLFCIARTVFCCIVSFMYIYSYLFCLFVAVVVVIFLRLLQAVVFVALRRSVHELTRKVLKPGTTR